MAVKSGTLGDSAFGRTLELDLRTLELKLLGLEIEKPPQNHRKMQLCVMEPPQDAEVKASMSKLGNRFLMESPSLTLCARWASLLMQQMRRQMLREAMTSEKLLN